MINKKEKRVKRGGKITTLLEAFFSYVLFFFVFFPSSLLFLSLTKATLLFYLSDKDNEKSFLEDLILFKKAEPRSFFVVIITIAFLCGLFLSMFFAFAFWKKEGKWEQQNQTDLKTATEKLEKQLLETKTELLLTQNKLRELKENN